MCHQPHSRVRRVVALIGAGLLVCACSVGAGGTASMPAGATDVTPAVAPATSGAPGDLASPRLKTPVPASVPAGPSALPATAPMTPVPSSTARPAASAAPTPAARPTLALPAPSPPATAVRLQLADQDNGRRIVVAVGSQVTLVLHNTYWQVQGSSDPAVLAMVSGPVTSGAGPIACIPGTGCGTVTAVFRAAAPGSTTITASRTSCGEALQCVGGAGSFKATVVVVP